MSFRYAGGLVTAESPVNANFPSGVWTNQQTMPYINGQVWTQDPYFQNTTLLLHGDGAGGVNNAQFSTFVDNSVNNFPITVNGDAYGDNFGPYAVPEGNWSNFFDGSGDSLTVTYNASMAPGSNNFTIEGWYYITETGTTELPFFIIGSNTYYPIGLSFLDSSGYKVQVNASYNGSSWAFNRTGNISISKNTWVHVALVRNSTALDVYVNGVKDTSASGSVSGSLASDTGGISIGAYRVGGTAEYNGYISNTRYVNGTAVYTSAFTPPTAPLTAITGTQLLTCQSNRFVDNSTNNFAITRNGDVSVQVFTPFTVTPNTTDGSGYFDGTGDFLQTPSFPVNFSVFCMEFWINTTSTTLNQTFINRGGSTWNISTVFNIYMSTTAGRITFLAGATVGFDTGTSSPVNDGAWHHLVFTYDGTTYRAFQDGVLRGTQVAASMGSDSQIMYLMHDPRNSRFAQGYLSNFRLVTGAGNIPAAYQTSSTTLGTQIFTPPTTRLTAISGTSLLTCQYQGNVNNNGFVDSGPYDFRITRVGNTTQGTFTPFSKPDGRWGNYFNRGRLSTVLTGKAAGTGSVTYELFFYSSDRNADIANYSALFNSRGSGTGADGIDVLVNSSGQVQIGSSAATLFQSSANLAGLNQWYHLAIVRNGSTNWTVYLNGTSIGTFSDSRNLSSTDLYLGVYGGNANDWFRGYMSNFRYTRAAVYTSNFTVPTSPLTVISNTEFLTCQSNRFVDNSANNFAITAAALNGTSPTATPFSPFPTTTGYSTSVNGGSGYFDGNGDYLTSPYSTSFEFGSRDWTVEAWIYVDATHWASSPAPIITYRADTNSQYGASFSTNNPGYATLALSTNGSSWAVVATSTNLMYGNAWNHVAFVRSGANIYIYTNGSRYTASTTYSGNVYIVPNVPAIIGRSGTGGDYQYQFKGSMGGLRVVNNTALYTAATISVPTAPFTPIANTTLLLNFTGAGILDNTGFNNLETVGNSGIATNIEKYGTGSMFFDGTGDYLAIPSNPAFNVGTGNFTLEYWVRPTVLTSGTTYNIFKFYSSATSNGPEIDGTANFGWWKDTVGLILESTTIAAINTWYHIAYVRSGTTFKLYVNGVEEDSVTNSDSFNFSTWDIGRGYYNSNFAGFLDDFRLTVGVARYTTNFTPPIARMPNQ